MSWDICIQDLPDVASVADIPDDFEPGNIGPRSAIIAKILEAVPQADFSDPAWGLIDGEDWSIEVNIGEEEQCGAVMLHVRGSDGALPVVAAIVGRLGRRAIDTGAGEFFDPATAAGSFAQWRSFRDASLGEEPPSAGPKRRGFFSRIFG